MRVIITGGTGLIGSALSKSLAGDGHEVIVLSRSPQKFEGKLPRGVQAVRWDARTADGWGHLANGADAIVNLAGENLSGTGFFPSRWTDEKRRRILESRVHAGQAVIEAIEQAEIRPGVLVQGSAVGYYGYSLDRTFTESDPPGDDFLARVQLQAEASTDRTEPLGVRRAIARMGVSLSREDKIILPRLMLSFKFFAGAWYGSGNQWFPWIHIRDTVRAIRFLIETERAAGPFNLTAPGSVTNKEFCRILGKVMRRPMLLPVPDFAMRLAFSDVVDVLLKGQRVIPARLLEMGFQFEFPDLEPALRDLLG